MNNTELISHLKSLIIKSKLNETIDELLAISGKVSDSDFNNGIIMQAGKLSSLNSDKADGIVGNAFLGIEFAKLKKSLLYYIEQLSDFPKIDYQPKNIIAENPQITNQETNKMTGKQKKQFDKAFLSAFNSYSSLNQILDYIDIDLDSFSNSSRNLNEVILNIRDYGEQHNSLFKIIEAALDEVPENVDLNKLITKFAAKISDNSNDNNEQMGNVMNTTGNGNISLQEINGNVNFNKNNNAKANNSDEREEERIKTKILFLAANPSNEARVQTDKEFETIKQQLNSGEERDKFELLMPTLSLTVQELIKVMNKKPNIVHFAGHGEEEGIIITNSHNERQLMPTKSLKRLFRQHKEATKLVVLNSCYSAAQAETISNLGFYVIGMNTEVADTASLSFAGGLYIGLAAGKEVEMAYDDAMIVLEADFPDVSTTPEIWKDGKKLDL